MTIFTTHKSKPEPQLVFGVGRVLLARAPRIRRPTLSSRPSPPVGEKLPGLSALASLAKAEGRMSGRLPRSASGHVMFQRARNAGRPGFLKYSNGRMVKKSQKIRFRSDKFA